MEKQLNKILKEQIILAFHEKGLDDLIVFFMAKYPKFSYVELNFEQLTSDYLAIYDLPFLASYIRYSDLSLLKSGMQDEEIREKLCFLHNHIGTIIPAYREFIWSDYITLEDLKRWLPLLSNFRIKNRIMKCNKITNEYKNFLDLCLDENSFAYQNLVLLDVKYPTVIIEMDLLTQIQNHESFYKLLQLIIKNNISISNYDLFNCFSSIEGLLNQYSLSFLLCHRFWMIQYLQDFKCFFPLNSVRDLHFFATLKKSEHLAFLEEEYQIFTLKEFYCWVFLGIHYQKFEKVFLEIPEDQSKEYQLLKKLYDAKFPLSLKSDLYEQFLKCGNFRDYIENALLKTESLDEIKLKSTLTFVDDDHSLITMQNVNFQFLTSSIEDYKNASEIVFTTIQSDKSFTYQEGCLLSYSDLSILSYENRTCIVKKKDLVPSFLVAFDYISLEHLKFQKLLGLPIVIIDTEVYTENIINHLKRMFASEEWDSYIIQKRNLFLSIQNHPWLFTKYFKVECLYEDVKVWQSKIENWILEKDSSLFIRKQLQVLKKLISLNEELELMFTKEKKFSFQYRKKMLQYGLIID